MHGFCNNEYDPRKENEFDSWIGIRIRFDRVLLSQFNFSCPAQSLMRKLDFYTFSSLFSNRTLATLNYLIRRRFQNFPPSVAFLLLLWNRRRFRWRWKLINRLIWISLIGIEYDFIIALHMECAIVIVATFTEKHRHHCSGNLSRTMWPHIYMRTKITWGIAQNPQTVRSYFQNTLQADSENHRSQFSLRIA